MLGMAFPKTSYIYSFIILYTTSLLGNSGPKSTQKHHKSILVNASLNRNQLVGFIIFHTRRYTERERVPTSLDCCPFQLMPYNEDSLQGRKVNLIWAFHINHGILSILIATTLITTVAAFRCTDKNWPIWRVATKLWWQTYITIHISIKCLDVTATKSRNIKIGHF